MTTNVNPSLATLHRLLSYQFVTCLSRVSTVPLEPPIEAALAKVAEVIGAKRFEQVGRWRARLESSPVQLCAAAVSMVQGAKALQEWVDTTCSPGTPQQLWLEIALSLEPILDEIAAAQLPRVPPHQSEGLQ